MPGSNNQLDNEKIIDILIFLERNLGYKVKYDLFEPVGYCLNNLLALQKLAGDIANFIGLRDFIFIVGYAKKQDHSAGTIELNNSDKEVFIDFVVLVIILF